MTNKYWLAVVIICSSWSACAQDDYEISPFLQPDAFNLHFAGTIGIPSRDLKKAVNNKLGNLGAGISAGIFLNPFGKKKPSPVMPGLDFNYLVYGVDVIEEASNHPRIKTVFNVYSITAGIRVLPMQKKAFTPFADGMIGSRIFNTRTKVVKDEPEVIHSTNDAGLTYILGAGFFVRHPKPDPDGIDVSFMLRFLYFWGTDTQYVKRDSFQIDQNNTITFETGRTNTTMYNIQLGLVIH